MALALLALALPQAATVAAGEGRIFRTVDEDGNVVFTDIPPREEVESEQIVVETPNSFAIDEAVPQEARDLWVVETPEAGEEPTFRYTTLGVASPQDDEPIRENSGNISIIANVAPRLQSGHVMRLLMDGAVVQEGPQSTFNLANVDRGTHTIALEIVDENGRAMIRSDDSTFHMLRFRIP
ncbi:MAG: DUF4124 domain-containing protein [Pseudomonadota bacterium]